MQTAPSVVARPASSRHSPHAEASPCFVADGSLAVAKPPNFGVEPSSGGQGGAGCRTGALLWGDRQRHAADRGGPHHTTKTTYLPYVLTYRSRWNGGNGRVEISTAGSQLPESRGARTKEIVKIEHDSAVRDMMNAARQFGDGQKDSVALFFLRPSGTRHNNRGPLSSLLKIHPKLVQRPPFFFLFLPSI
ncbi:hypothetical protein GQ53DRAFT_270649 [Thozetella sp. PMI_491]|nr:hypothetical protein GQ53DRAFT_270649 [Thozetella sp. PMI_491]